MRSPNKLIAISRSLIRKPAFRLSVFILSLLVAAQFLGSSSASRYDKGLGDNLSRRSLPVATASGVSSERLLNPRSSSNVGGMGLLSALTPQPAPPPGPEAIATYEGTCTTASQHFTVDSMTHTVTVCAKAANLDSLAGPRSIYWVNPDRAVVQVDPVTPGSPSATRVIDTLGNWSVYLVDASDGSARAVFDFTVSDAANPKVDLSVFKSATGATGDFAAGGFISYQIIVKNKGPDTASSVTLTDAVPANTAYSSSSQDFGSFTRTQETPVTTWTIASLAPGASAEFTFTYQIAGGTPAGTLITNTAEVEDVTFGSPNPDELHPEDNTWTAANVVVAGGGGATCSLDCPNSVVVTATTHGTGGGAVVDYASPDASGTCGTVHMSQASHTFFPTGTTTVTATSDTGGGFCSFTVTVIDSPAPTISCPGPLTASTVTGSGDAQAFVPGPSGPSDPGTPTATGNNVTVTGGRSDGLGLTDAYPIGVTTITWTARECNDFPQCTNAFARSASCTQTITVTSADIPTITCPSDKSFDAAGDCQKTLSATDIGTPTTGGLNPTVVSARSDGLALTDPFPAGVTLITWTASNNLGSASCTQRITITTSGDTTPPTFTSVPPDVSVTTDTCSAQIEDALGSASATDNCSAVTITRTGVPRVPCPIPGDPGRTCESFIFPVGTTDITYTATDAAGNAATAVQHVTVHENTPPTFTFVPGNVGPINNDAGLCGAFVGDATLGTATVSDNCDTTVIRTGVPAGNIFPVGSTTITYTARADITVQATQIVTVVDNTPPVVHAPAAVTLYTGAGATSCGVTVSNLNTTLGTGSATDNCAGVSAVTRSGVPAGNFFPVGQTTLTYSATDAHSNTASDTQIVTVVDNTPPVITLNGQTPSMWPPNHKYQTFGVTNFVTGVTDNCGTISVSSVVITKVTSDEAENGNGSGNTLNDIVIAADCKSVQLRSEREGGGDGRVYTIYFKVVDSHGNVGTATAKVVVQHNPGETAVDSGVHYTVLSNCP